MKWAIIAAICAVVLGGAAAVFFVFMGGETNAEVIARFEPKFQDLRNRFKKIVGKLPPKGSVTANQKAANLDPAPIYDVQTGNFNTAILMEDHLRNPDADLPTPQTFNIRLGDADLLTHLRWTGPNNPMAPSAQNSTARADMAKEMERSLTLPYLVVIRTVQYAQPVVQGNSFLGGRLTLEGFVIDMNTENVIASFQTSAKPRKQVQSTFRKGVDDPDQRGESWVYSSMWRNARDNVAQALTEVTGGRFVFER